jgi:hypothetical protein
MRSEHLDTTPSGLDGPLFPADSFKTFACSARGVVREIGSSFGVLASELRTSGQRIAGQR